MSDSQCRPMVLPLEGLVPGVTRLLYHGKAHQQGAGCMHACRGVIQPWTCACLPGVSAALTRARYVQVYDNRLEINEPDSVMVGCGTCILTDRITTIHFVSRCPAHTLSSLVMVLRLQFRSLRWNVSAVTSGSSPGAECQSCRIMWSLLFSR
jgi:hypothetical protein